MSSIVDLDNRREFNTTSSKNSDPMVVDLFIGFSQLKTQVNGPDVHMRTAITALQDMRLSWADALWWLGVYTTFCSVSPGAAVWSRWPDPAALLASGDGFIRWIADNWAGLPVRTQRRPVRSRVKLAECIHGMANWCLRYGPRLQNMSYEEAWNSVNRTVKFYGRYALIKLLEAFRRVGYLQLEAPDIRPNGAWSPRAMLGYIYPGHAPGVFTRVSRVPGAKPHIRNDGRTLAEVNAVARDALTLLEEGLGRRSSYYELEVLLCLRGDTWIQTSQGPLKISTIVNRQLPVKVKTLYRGQVCYLPVTGWFKNKRAGRRLLRIELKHAHWSNKAIVTEDHLFITPVGKVPANKLDRHQVLTGGLAPSAELFELIEGSLLGDMTIYRHGSIRVNHQERDASYATYKHEQLSKLQSLCSLYHVDLTRARARGGKSKNAQDQKSVYLGMRNWGRQLAERWLDPVTGQKRLPDDFVLTPRSLAIWFLDDGTGANHEGGSAKITNARVGWYPQLESGLRALGFSPKMRPEQISIRFSVDDTKRLVKLISPYVPVGMSRKLPPGQPCGGCAEIIDATVPEVDVASVTEVKTSKRHPMNDVYCLEVEGAHMFATPGGLVSNCNARQSLYSGTLYVGRTIDSELDYWRKSAAHFGDPTSGRFDLFDVRRRTFPIECLGEVQGWGGVRKELKTYRGYVWSDMLFDYNATLANGDFDNPVRR